MRIAVTLTSVSGYRKIVPEAVDVLMFLFRQKRRRVYHQTVDLDVRYTYVLR